MNTIIKAMRISKSEFYTVFIFMGLGIGLHLLPHPAGLSVVGGLSMISAYYLPRRVSLFPPAVVALVGQIFAPGSFPLEAMAIVFAGHILAMLAIMFDRLPLGFVRYGRGALVHAVVFYLVSNLAPLALGYYPNTVAGWVACYVAGIPFLFLGLLSNLVYGGVGFLTIERFIDMPRLRRFLDA